MSQPDHAGPGPVPDLPQTVLDAGRMRRGGEDLPATLIDSGRARSATSWRVTLPPHLAGRFELDRELSRRGGQADLYLVTERATGEPRVIKHYRTARTTDPQVLAYLNHARTRQVVRLYETGADYEIMEYLPHGTLLDFRRSQPAGFSPETMHDIVRQLATALIDMHRGGVVHRDVKPANVLLRSVDPLDIVIADMGISVPFDGDERFLETRSGTPAYLAPEYLTGQLLSAELDWWALGISLVEVATGRNPFADLPPQVIHVHVATRPINVAGIGDARLRLLCQGLLRRDPKRRWGEKQVREWLEGGSPGVAPEPIEDDQPAARLGFTFNGRAYRSRDELALALTNSWEYAARELFGGDSGRLRALREWLDQFRDERGAAARATVEAIIRQRRPANVQLLHLVRALDPAQPPVYRNEIITPGRLRELAYRAIASEGAALHVLADLWQHRLLDVLAVAPGGTGFGEQNARWRAERTRWHLAASRVTDPQARAELGRMLRNGFAHAVWLRAATGGEDEHAAALVRVREVADTLPVPVPWFRALAREPDAVWVADMLSGRARAEAGTTHARLRAEAEERQALLLTGAVREWSRRQNRPLAMAWAVAGVAALAAVWAVLLAFSDVANVVGETAVELAMIVAGVSAGVSLAFESLLAANIGGRFHPRYSMPGAGGIILGRLGARTAGHGTAAFLILLGFAAALGAVVALLPMAVPVASTIGHAGWVLVRHREWTAQMAEEDAMIAQAIEERAQHHPM